MRKKKIIHYLSFFVSILLIITLLSIGDLSEIIKSLSNIDIFSYSLAFIMYFMSYICRSLRLKILFESKYSYKYFLIISGHQLLNRTLPFRTGEMALPFFLKKNLDISYSAAFPTIFLLRLFDFAALISTFIFIVILFGFNVKSNIIILILSSLLISIILIINLKKIFLIILTSISKLISKKFSHKIEHIKIETAQALSISTAKIIYLFCLSVLDRIFNYGVSIILILGMSFEIPVFKVIIANALSSITEILPVNSIGSFGTLELGWAGALIYYGVSKEIAIASGFSFHILTITFTLTLGLVSIFIMNFKNSDINKKNPGGVI